MGKSIWDLVGQEVDVPCSDIKGNIQGVAKSETKPNLTELWR